MSILHIVRRSAFQTNDFSQCVDMLDNVDTLVFIDDGCYNLNHPLMDKAESILTDGAIYSISSHCLARAVNASNINIIEMSALVTLCLSAKTTLTWQ